MRTERPISKFERFMHSDAFWGGLFTLFVLVMYIGSYFTKQPVPDLVHIMAVCLAFLYGSKLFSYLYGRSRSNTSSTS